MLRRQSRGVRWWLVSLLLMLAAPSVLAQPTAAAPLAPGSPSAPAPSLRVRLPFRCAVPEVEVYLDEQPVSEATRGVSLMTAPGEHSVRFHRDGYQDDVHKVVLGRGSPATIQCSLTASPDLSPEKSATLYVPARPSDVMVRIDGRPLAVGQNMLRLPSGLHRVEMLGENIRAQSELLSLSAGESRKLALAPPPAPRVLTRQHAPASRVSRNVAYGLGALGLVAGLVAASLSLAADTRFTEWKQEDALVLSARSIDANVERQHQNDERLRSIWAMDDAALALGIGSGVVLATAVVFLFMSQRPDRPDQASVRPVFRLRGLGVRLDL